MCSPCAWALVNRTGPPWRTTCRSRRRCELAKLRQECGSLRRELSAQGAELSLLRARFARYETALRGSQVTVYTQDRDLRYTSISNPMLGRAIEDILGRTDEEILPPDSGAAVIALEARSAGERSGRRRAEIAIEDGSGLRWHDLHIEPLRNEAGDIVGLTCASVDVTERKEGEAHLRLLMRELTHRSKNLLAVIQAMARQTARHAGSIDGFLNQFARAAAGARRLARSAGARKLARRFLARIDPLAAGGLYRRRRRPGRDRGPAESRSSRKRRKISALRCMNWRSTPRNSARCRCPTGACRSSGRCER